MKTQEVTYLFNGMVSGLEESERFLQFLLYEPAVGRRIVDGFEVGKEMELVKASFRGDLLDG